MTYMQSALSCDFPASGADLGGGCRRRTPLPPLGDDLWLSNTTGILKKKTMWFIGVEKILDLPLDPVFLKHKSKVSGNCCKVSGK